MNWFNILKEQRQTTRNVQSFKPIQFEKPIKIKKPEKSCEEKFIERAKTAARGVGFNSFDPNKIADYYDDRIFIDEGVLSVRFYYENNSGKLRNRDPEVKDVTDDLFCWMMDNYDKTNLTNSWINSEKFMGSFYTLPQKYIKMTFSQGGNSIVKHTMTIWKKWPNKRVAHLDINFLFSGNDQSWQIGEKELNALIKKHFPNWRGGL